MSNGISPSFKFEGKGSQSVQPHAQPTLAVEILESLLRLAWISASDSATRRMLYFNLAGVNRTFREIAVRLPPVLLLGDEDDLLLHEKMAQAAGYYVCTSRSMIQEDSDADEDPSTQLPFRPCPQVHLHLPVSCYHFNLKLTLERHLVLMDSTYCGRLLCVIGACSSVVVHGPLPRPEHYMLERDELTLLGLIGSLRSLESIHFDYTPVFHAHSYNPGLRLPSARYLYLGADLSDCQGLSRRLCGTRLHRAFPNLRHLHLERAEYLVHFAFPPYLSTLSLHVHADGDHPTRHAGYAIQSALSREVFRPWRAPPVAGRMTIVVKHNLNSAVPLWWEETKNVAEEYGVLLVQTCCAHVCSDKWRRRQVERGI
ncbi:hypothetical protein C8Q74DRAFT_497201 [Fomes fomentarius]|nr:hypothetical protein C8Q74DRAFT_497201 [Fomes fomentarius]